MTIERNIENLTNAFRAFVEVRIKEEVDARMASGNCSHDEYWDIDSVMRAKYKEVLKYL